MPDIDIAIIGGGIAGLSAAVACQSVGKTAHVFEAAPKFAPMGTSLSLWPNAMGCLADWGLDDQVKSAGAMLDQLAWRYPDGRPIFTMPLDDIYAHLGHPAICIQRADLHHILAGPLPDGHVHLSHTLDRINTHHDHVALTFTNGQTITARQVIAADGLRSHIRATLFDEKPSRASGYGGWLGLSKGPAPGFAANEGCEILSPDGTRMGFFETGNDTRYWFVISRQDTVDAATPGTATDALARIEGWPDYARDLVAGAIPGSIIKVPFFDRPVRKHWGAGRIVLVGDAMHPFLPNLGQGACQAIEDAHTLAEGLRRGKGPTELRHWMEEIRGTRVAYFNLMSRHVGFMAQAKNPMLRWMRNISYSKPFHPFMRRQFIKQFTRPPYPRDEPLDAGGNIA